MSLSTAAYCPAGLQHRSGMAAAATSAGSANAIDPSFYLLEASLADLADAEIAVGGFSLPVHSQLLSMQSGVLRELFRGERETGGRVSPLQGLLSQACAAECHACYACICKHTVDGISPPCCAACC